MDNKMCIEPHPAMVECGFITEDERKQILLLKSMYGNVDTAIKFFKIFTRHLVDVLGGICQSLSDLCLVYKLEDKTGELVLIVTVTVDDCAITGLSATIDWFMDGVEKRFKIT